MKLSDNLKIIRKENNLSQEQLAEKLGVSRQAVSKWESGQSYPEMDKVLLICKMFNYNIDELMNENVKEVDETKQSKINLNKYIDDFFGFITKTVNMLSSMKLRQILKCIIEQIIIIFLLMAIFLVIGGIGSGILSTLTRGFNNNIYYFIRNICESIYTILALFIGITVFLHIFKIRYLDYYVIVKEKDDNNTTDENLKNDEEKNVLLERAKEKIIIRDPKHSQSKFLSGILRIIIWSIKFIALCTAIGFAFSFIGLVICLVISFLFVKTGLLFIGSFLGILSAIIVNFVILEILFNFIISKTNKKHRIAILLIVSLILAGLGIGLGLIGATKFNYIENPEVINEIEDVYETEMKDNLCISNWYGDQEFIETDSSNIKIVVKHSKYYTVKFYNQNEQIDIHYGNEGNSMEMVKDFIQDINDKEIKNYDIPKTIIYASKENIEKLKENETRVFEMQRKDEIEDLQEQINELEDQIRQYEENEQEKDMIIDSLSEQISENDELVNNMEEN